MTFDGTNWTVPANLSNNAGSSIRPAIEISNNGDVHVVWQDDTASAASYDILYATALGSASAGIISGYVRDASNNPIPSATVTIIGSGQSTTSTSNGRYVIAGLQPGTYSLTASKPYYIEQSQSDVQVSLGQTTNRDFVLSPVLPALPLHLPLLLRMVS